MTQKRVGNDEFLTHLTDLLASTTTANHGSVFLTQKALDTSQILIRATNGATTSKAKKGLKITKEQEHKKQTKIKLATVVEVADLEAFYAKYADVCKKGMEGMRKRDKKKAKEKAKAKKKKGNAAV